MTFRDTDLLSYGKELWKPHPGNHAIKRRSENEVVCSHAPTVNQFDEMASRLNYVDMCGGDQEEIAT